MQKTAERLRLCRGGRDPAAPAGAPIPAFGDVVGCYFPHNEARHRPGIKPRPCLVLKAVQAADGVWRLRLAYGTSRPPAAPALGEVTLIDDASLAAAGLHRPTRFILNYVRVVPFTFAYFRANRAGAVILGSLAAHDRDRVQQMLVAAYTGRQRGKNPTAPDARPPARSSPPSR